MNEMGTGFYSLMKDKWHDFLSSSRRKNGQNSLNYFGVSLFKMEFLIVSGDPALKNLSINITSWLD